MNSPRPLLRLPKQTLRNVALLVLAAYAVLHVRPLSAQSGQAPKPKGKQNATQLLESANKSLAYTVKSTRAAGPELAATTPKAKPCLQSLKKVSTSLQAADKSLRTKNKSFFNDIAAAQAGIEAMQITWELTGSKNAGVIKGGTALSGAVAALNENYSPLAGAKTLSPAEKKNFDKIRASQDKLSKSIDKAPRVFKRNPAVSKGLKKMQAKALGIKKAPAPPAAYTASVGTLALLTGMLDSYSYYVSPADHRGAPHASCLGPPASPAGRGRAGRMEL
ncbi:MAG: hypothetical protein ACOYOL_01140 [Chthoniobacterales bacterium]